MVTEGRTLCEHPVFPVVECCF